MKKHQNGAYCFKIIKFRIHNWYQDQWSSFFYLFLLIKKILQFHFFTRKRSLIIDYRMTTKSKHQVKRWGPPPPKSSKPLSNWYKKWAPKLALNSLEISLHTLSAYLNACLMLRDAGWCSRCFVNNPSL